MAEKIYMVMERRYNDRHRRDSHVCLGCFRDQSIAESYMHTLYINDPWMYDHIYLCDGEIKDGIILVTSYLYVMNVTKSMVNNDLVVGIVSRFVQTKDKPARTSIDSMMLTIPKNGIVVKVTIPEDNVSIATMIARQAVLSIIGCYGEISQANIDEWMSNPENASKVIEACDVEPYKRKAQEIAEIWKDET